MFGTIRFRTQGAGDIGFQKLFMQKKASIKISFTDILSTADWAGKTKFAGIYGRLSGNWESQTFPINFTYVLEAIK